MIRAIFFGILYLSLCQVSYSAEKRNWIITQLGTQQTYDTLTQLSERKGIQKSGLISVSRSGQNTLQTYWEPGAHRATTIFNRTVIVDGYDIDDISRIKSFRFNKKGDTVFLKTTKGPDAIVELFFNDKSILTWPRLSIVSILSFQKDSLYLSFFSKKNQTTEFWKYAFDSNNKTFQSGKLLGILKKCALLSSKVLKEGIAIQTYCSPERGSDVQYLNFSTGGFQTIKATNDDEYLAYSLTKHDRSKIPVLSLTGSEDARQLYHAVTLSFTKYLGEPTAYASDESGKQSWSQSYRTLTLATLFEKTGMVVFARLAEQAMDRTLSQQNQIKNISGPINPSCAWASRIYSIDGKSPISFMINQGMISSSLIQSCKLLGDNCPLKLKVQILNNATCLILSYEKLYDQKAGLYRIPYKAPFRYDGIWAPWNWHMMWSGVLSYVGAQTGDKRIQDRAISITHSFFKSWELTKEKTSRALWRYWPSQYYQGWKQEDLVSASRPIQSPKKMQKERYEDINHASISLLGLSHMSVEIPGRYKDALKNTLNNLLKSGPFLPRDMDGKGPLSPRWLPGAGWDLVSTPLLEQLYSRHLPGASTGDQHLSYARLFSTKRKFELRISISECSASICTEVKKWSNTSIKDFIANNPLFSITEIPNR